MDGSLPGSSVHGIFQARILESVAISSSRGSSRPRDSTSTSYVSCLHCQVGSLPLVPPGKPHFSEWDSQTSLQDHSLKASILLYGPSLTCIHGKFKDKQSLYILLGIKRMFPLGHKIGMCLGGGLSVFLGVGSSLFLTLVMNVFMSVITHKSVGLNLCTLFMW